MENLLREVYGKTFRVKCHHGCEHAGDGVLFKFKRSRGKDKITVEEIGLDRHDSYKIDCDARLGSSENWALLKQRNEERPYTFAIHRVGGSKFEIYIAGQDAAVDYQLEEVDPRYENRDYYERRPSLKKARRGRSTSRDEELEMEAGARQGEYCAHSRSLSRSRSRSRSLRESDEGSYSYSYDDEDDEY